MPGSPVQGLHRPRPRPAPCSSPGDTPACLLLLLLLPLQQRHPLRPSLRTRPLPQCQRPLCQHCRMCQGPAQACHLPPTLLKLQQQKQPEQQHLRLCYRGADRPLLSGLMCLPSCQAGPSQHCRLGWLAAALGTAEGQTCQWHLHQLHYCEWQVPTAAASPRRPKAATAAVPAVPKAGHRVSFWKPWPWPTLLLLCLLPLSAWLSQAQPPQRLLQGTHQWIHLLPLLL